MTDSDNIDSEQEQPKKRGVFGAVMAWLAPVSWLIIAMGEFSDASLLLNEVRVEMTSKFTNTYEYETIDGIHVGNTVSFIEDMVGQPQVSRDLGDGISGNYFFSEKFLLTLFYRDNRVTAYTVLSLKEDFNPEISGLDDKIGGIGEFRYSDLPAPAEAMLVDHSRVASYYIEAVDMERSGRFLDLYMGSVIYGAGGAGPEVAPLYNATVFGSDQEVANLQAKLRSNSKPNFFGRGEVPLQVVQESLLSTSEFLDYFDPK